MLTFLRVIVSLLGIAGIAVFLYYVMPMVLESPPHGVYLSIDGHAVLDMRMNRPEGTEPDPSAKIEVLSDHDVKLTTIFYSAAGLSNLVFAATMDGKEIPIEVNLSADPGLPDAIEFKMRMPVLPQESANSVSHKIRIWAVDRSRNLRSEDLFAYVLPVASQYIFKIDKVADIAVNTDYIVGTLVNPEVNMEATVLQKNLKTADEYEAVAILTPKYNPEFEKKRAEEKKKGKAAEPTPEEEQSEKMKIYEILLGKPLLATDKDGQIALGKIKQHKVYSESVGRYAIEFASLLLGGDDDFDRRFLIHVVLVKKGSLDQLKSAISRVERVGDLLDDASLQGKIIMVDDGIEVHRKQKAKDAQPAPAATTGTAPAQSGGAQPATGGTTPATPTKPEEGKKTDPTKPSGEKSGTKPSTGGKSTGGKSTGGKSLNDFGGVDWK